MDSVYERADLGEGLDLWASYFHVKKDQKAYAEYRHENPAREELEKKALDIAFKRGDKVLDLGCGTGLFIEKLKKKLPFNLACIGFDISLNAIRLAGKRVPDALFYVGEGEYLALPDESFDVVMLYSVLQHMLNPDLVIKEAYRVLKPGGRMLWTIHKPALDFFIIPTLFRKLLSFTKRLIVGKSNSGYSMPLNKTRKLVFGSFENITVDWVFKTELAVHMEFMAYRKLGFTRKFLFSFANRLHRLPFRYFKDLELFVCRKPNSF